MMQSWRKVLLSVCSLIVSACTLADSASDAMNTRLIAPATKNPEETAAAQAALPPNFRTLVAEYVRSHPTYPIRDAKITSPYQRWGGLLRGGTMNCVCVAIYRDNPLGILVRDNRVFTFENGKVQEILLGTEPCSDLSTFQELKG